MQVDEPAAPCQVPEFTFQVVDGPFAGARLGWHQAEVVLGRAAEGSTLFRSDTTISHRHAIVRCGPEGTCLVEDAGSANGTFVNDVLINRPTVLTPEDEVRIGRTHLRLASTPADTTIIATAKTSEASGPGWGVASDEAVAGATNTNRAQARRAGQLGLSILAAIAGTVLASTLNGSPQLRLLAATLGAAVPAFVTEPGRYQRQRVAAAALLLAVALFVTYGGATVFSYATKRAPIYPIPPAVPRPNPTVTPTLTVSPTPTVTPTLTVSPTVTPTLTVSPTPTVTPTLTVTPTPAVTPSGPTAPQSNPAP